MTDQAITFDDLVSQITLPIYKYIDDNKELLDHDSTMVLADRFEKREKYAPELEKLLNVLGRLTSMVSTAINDATSAHQHDINTMGQLMTKTRPKNWIEAVKKKQTNVSLSAPSVQYTKPKIKITPSLSLQVIKTTNLSGVKSDGELYYVESLNQFAFKLAGVTFRGNIGTLYTDNTGLVKIRECKYAKTCVKGSSCDFYHDPLTTYGSQDKRNFIASSFSYVAPENRKTRHNGKKFGSLVNLDSDIVSMDNEEIQKYLDMTTHDVLCSLLLASVHLPT